MAKKSIMLLEVVDNKRPLPEVLIKVAAKTKRSPLSIAVEMIRRALPPQRLMPAMFLAHGVWRSELTALQKSQYLGVVGSHRLNKKATTRGPDRQNRLIEDKFLTAAVLTHAGIRTPRILAAYATERSFGPVPMLRDRAALADFLGDPANLPCFGKPFDGSRSRGSVWVKAAVGDGRLLLGDGREVAALDLADEVIAHFPGGWLIQEFVRLHPDIIRVSGPALGSMRIVTIWPKGQSPRVLYCLWRLPGPGAQDDSLAAKEFGVALVDHDTGTVTRVHWGDYVTGREVTTSPAALDGAPILGFVIPQFAELVAQLCKLHETFPGHGILGFDATISDQGPLVTEINGSPFHTGIQLATGLPFATPEILAAFDNAAEAVSLRARPAERRGFWSWR